jgi:regulator of replication initiation timing
MAELNILRRFKVREISLVDEGDNPHADLLILKRRDMLVPTPVLKARFASASAMAGALFELAAGAEGQDGCDRAQEILKGMDMDINTLNEKLAEIEVNLETVTKANTELKAENESLKAANAELVEKAKAAPAAETDEDILKGLPEPVRKRLEAAEAAAAAATELVEKANAERETGEYVAKARALNVTDADGVGGLLYRIAKGKTTAEDADKFEGILKQAGTINAEGEKLFTAIGKSAAQDASDADEAQRELDGKIEAIQKAKPTLSYAQAYTEALDANPSLYERVAKRKPVPAAE